MNGKKSSSNERINIIIVHVCYFYSHIGNETKSINLQTSIRSSLKCTKKRANKKKKEDLLLYTVILIQRTRTHTHECDHTRIIHKSTIDINKYKYNWFKSFS